MSITLEALKNLRQRGASVQMQEDLASFLEGGYNSELFLPTIDFILSLKNPPKSQQQDIQQEQSVDLSEFDIPEVYDPKYFEKISIKAAGEIIKGAELEEQLRQEILAYLDNMEIQRAQYRGVLGTEDPEMTTSRAKISESKRRDRGTKNVKSMFEALVNGLNALQVRVTQQNAVRKAQQEKINTLTRIQNIITQKFQSDSGNKDAEKGGDHGRIAKSERKFLKKMRKVLDNRRNNNNESNSSDSQQNRSGGNKDERYADGKAVADVAHKYDQAQEHAAKSADDYKSAEQKKDVQVVASKTIDAAKKVEEAEKGGNDKASENTRTESRIRNTNLQQRLQRTRIRLQQQREEALRQEHAKQDSTHNKIDDMTAQKAVHQLKNMGVSLSDSDVAKMNKELSNVAKLQDKHRGG